MVDQSVSQSISPRVRRSAQELARDYGPEEVEEAYRVAGEQKARSPNAYAEALLRERWGERRERRGASAAQARRLKDICDRCELTHYYDNLTVWVGWALCNDCKRAVLTDPDRHSETSWSREDKPTPAAERVAAYWRSVEEGKV